MIDKEKNIKPIDQELMEYYLEELTRVKSIDPQTLKKVHLNIRSNKYSNQQVFDSITENLLEDKTFN